MGFWSYVLAASTLQVRRGEFTPREVLAVHASWGAALWAAEAVFVWAALRSLSSSHNHISAPMMDLAAYTGYAFVLVAAALATKILNLPGWTHLLSGGWGALASAVFMVKTTKRIIFSEARSRVRRKQAQLRAAVDAGGAAVPAALLAGQRIGETL